MRGGSPRGQHLWDEPLRQECSDTALSQIRELNRVKLALFAGFGVGEDLYRDTMGSEGYSG